MCQVKRHKNIDGFTHCKIRLLSYNVEGNWQASGENSIEFLNKNRTFRVLKLGSCFSYLHIGVFMMLKVIGYITMSHIEYRSREGECSVEGVKWEFVRRNMIDVWVFHCATIPSGPGYPHFWGLTITLTRTTFDKTRLRWLSARRKDLYMTTNNTLKRQTFMSRRDSNLKSQQANGRRPTL
jgi:hypothetical protein